MHNETKSMQTWPLLVFTIFYQIQSYHPIILDSDLMKNFKGFILAQKRYCSFVQYAPSHYQDRVYND